MKTGVLEISMTIVACCVAGLVLAGPQEDLLYDGKMNPACVWDRH